MKELWRSPGNAFWALDQALGGHQRPARVHRWVARHPVLFGLCTGVPFALLFAVIGSEEESDGLFAVVVGLLMGSVFALFAFLERLRQRRLKRLGIWDGS
ncbi:hypothetical protein DIZ27_16925 [Streptomyces sp. NWU339]|nr:hypothetical protein DIZ27_16925 [Streptomyces sp. NWU339]